MLELRPYQQEALDAVYNHLRRRDDNPCVVLPTGAGKTPCLARICQDTAERWHGRILVLSHVKELLEQAANHLASFLPINMVGLHSAGLGRRDTSHPVIVAGIQTVANKACDLGAFNLIVVDEAHLIPESGEGRYLTFLRDAKVVNPNVRVVGLTATPFRLGSGLLCKPGNILNHVCYDANVKELILAGWLCPLRTRRGMECANLDSVKIASTGDFASDEMQAAFEHIIKPACAEIISLCAERRSVLIFSAGIEHARMVADILGGALITGSTSKEERAAAIADFRAGGIKYLVNVNVLTTGFDAPNVDAVVLLRATMSAGLYCQMCLDMKTEVLTPSGWRKCHEITKGDLVASFDLDTEEVAFAPALGKVHRRLAQYESMYGVIAPHLDIRVTDNHNMIVRGRSKTCRQWQLQTAKDASARKDCYKIPVAGHCLLPDADISDMEVAFLGWFLTDGYLNPHNNTISISQTESKFADEVRRVLYGCGFTFKEYSRPRTGRLADYEPAINFVVAGGNWNHLESWLDKDIPAAFDSLSSRQFGILLNAMNMANGRHVKNIDYTPRTMTISVGCRRRMADRIQALAVMRGYRCNIIEWTPDPSEWNAHPQPQWLIRIKRQANAYVGGLNCSGNALIKERCRIAQIDFLPNEWVWCLETIKGTLVTRRNGKIAILGNCGRGLRKHPSKTDCLILDYGDNAIRHGPIDQIEVHDRNKKKSDNDDAAPGKTCPNCQEVIAVQYRICPTCGYEFPYEPKPKHNGRAGDAPILSEEPQTKTVFVQSVRYREHVKQKDGGPSVTFRVEYILNEFTRESVNQFICFDHPAGSWARREAERWWMERSIAPAPATVMDAVAWARKGALAEPIAITLLQSPGNKYPEIVGMELSDIPDKEWDEEEDDEFFDADPAIVVDANDIPF